MKAETRQDLKDLLMIIGIILLLFVNIILGIVLILISLCIKGDNK